MSKYNKKSLDKLLDISDELEEELVDIKLKHSQGKLRDTSKIRKTKKDLARVNTAINIKSEDIQDE
jgi:ribosomal protein L29